MKKTSMVLLVSVLVLSACAIRQTAKPVERLEGRQICVLENPAVKNGFVQAYRTALERKGYEVRLLPSTAVIDACPVTSTYRANWRWDLATYMAYAELRIYREGKPQGEVIYDAMGGGGNLNKFISAEKKITEMVDQLLPGGAGS